MAEALRTLLVLDNQGKATRVLRELTTAGYEPLQVWVRSSRPLGNALRHRSWDLLIADSRLWRELNHRDPKLQHMQPGLPALMISEEGDPQPADPQPGQPLETVAWGALEALAPAVRRLLAGQAEREPGDARGGKRDPAGPHARLPAPLLRPDPGHPGRGWRPPLTGFLYYQTTEQATPGQRLPDHGRGPRPEPARGAGQARNRAAPARGLLRSLRRDDPGGLRPLRRGVPGVLPRGAVPRTAPAGRGHHPQAAGRRTAALRAGGRGTGRVPAHGGGGKRGNPARGPQEPVLPGAGRRAAGAQRDHPRTGPGHRPRPLGGHAARPGDREDDRQRQESPARSAGGAVHRVAIPACLPGRSPTGAEGLRRAGVPGGLADGALPGRGAHLGHRPGAGRLLGAGGSPLRVLPPCAVRGNRRPGTGTARRPPGTRRCRPESAPGPSRRTPPTVSWPVTAPGSPGSCWSRAWPSAPPRGSTSPAASARPAKPSVWCRSAPWPSPARSKCRGACSGSWKAPGSP